jgi:hypothetical protein
MKKVLFVFSAVLIIGLNLTLATRVTSVSKLPVIIEGCGYFDDYTEMWVKVKCGWLAS